MNKEEFEQKLEQLDSMVTELKPMVAQAEKLKDELKAQLAEAEKPKHGDYGISSSGSARIVLRHESQLVTAGNGSVHPYEVKYYYPNPVLGNIFTDLKAITEPLEKFKTDVHTYQINIRDFPHAPIGMAGNWHTIPEAEEHHRKLGRLIHTAKLAEAGKQ